MLKITLKTKLILIVIPLMIIPIILLGTLSYHYMIEMNKQHIFKQAKIHLTQLKQATHLHFQTAHIHLNILAQLLESKKFNTLSEIEVYNIVQLFFDHHLQQYQQISLLSSNNRLLFSAHNPTIQPPQATQLPTFQTLQQNTNHILTEIGTNHIPYFLAIKRLKKAVLILKISTHFLDEYLQSMLLTKNSYALFLDK